MGTYTPNSNFYKPVGHESNYEVDLNPNWDLLDLLHGGVANVMDPQYAGGATGDDSADDTAAFNAARAALPSTGGVVYAPPPPVRYKVTASLAPYTANQRFVGAGQVSTQIKFTGTGYLFTFGSLTDPALSYGCGCSGFKILLTNNAGNGIRFAGTAMGRPEDIIIEGVPNTNTSIGVMWDGGVAANIFGAPQNIICNHIKYGHVMDQSNAAGYVTSLNARNCTAFGDGIAGSRGWDIRTALGIFNNGSGSHIVGGNVENCARGISTDGVGITWESVRFENNTADVYWDTNARGNNCIGFQGADTWSDVPSSITNQRIGCTQSDNSPLANWLGAGLKSAGNLTFSVAAAIEGLDYISVAPAAASTLYLGAAADTGNILARRELEMFAGKRILLDSYMQLTEQADPAAPAGNAGRVYLRDNGSGKSQLVVRFASGAVQVIATEP